MGTLIIIVMRNRKNQAINDGNGLIADLKIDTTSAVSCLISPTKLSVNVATMNNINTIANMILISVLPVASVNRSIKKFLNAMAKFFVQIKHNTYISKN